MSTNNNKTEGDLRNDIALELIRYGSIILGVLALVILVSGVIMAFKGDDIDKGIELMKTVFNSLLPVIAAWIGTVIAFYFGRANFESASRQINNLVNKLSPAAATQIPVKPVMIDLQTMVKMVVKDPAKVTWGDLASYFTGDTAKPRLPVLDSNNFPVYVIHKDEYERQIASDPANKPKELISATSGSYGFQQTKGFNVIAESGTLSDAQDAMNKVKGCEDVFVSKTGTAKEALTGWLTNDKILAFLQSADGQ